MTEAIIDQSKRLLAASERTLKMLVSNVSASVGTRSNVHRRLPSGGDNVNLSLMRLDEAR